MSKEKAMQFLKEYRYNEEALKILEQNPKPETSDEAIAQIADVAGKFGFQITEEEIEEALRELEEERRAKTDAGTEDLLALDDSDLDAVAGGKGHDACMDTFEDRENCWWEDACDIEIRGYVEYNDYICSWHNKEA